MVTNWYYAKNNERHGPVSLADVRRLLASGSLQPTDLVWAEHLPGWVAAQDVREIASRDFLSSIPGLLLHFFCVIGAASGNPWTEGTTTVVRE